MPVCCRAGLRRHGAETRSARTAAVACTTLLASRGHAPAPVATVAGTARGACLAVATPSGGYRPNCRGTGHWMLSCVFA